MLKFIRYVLRNMRRNQLRSGLTMIGVTVSIFLFCVILSLNHGIQTMLAKSGNAQTLVVFQKNRY